MGARIGAIMRWLQRRLGIVARWLRGHHVSPKVLTETLVAIVVVAVIALLVAVLTTRDTDPTAGDRTPTAAPTTARGASDSPQPTVTVPVLDESHAMKQPGPLEGPLLATDILIYSPRELSGQMVKRINKMKGIFATNRFSLASAPIRGDVYTVASVDPATFRRFSSSGKRDEIWARIAAGEMALPKVDGDRIEGDNHFVRVGQDEEAESVHVGAYIEPPHTIDLIVNEKWGEDLFEVHDNALIISTNKRSPESVRKGLQTIVGKGASIQMLDAAARYGLDPGTVQTAVPTGGSVGAAVGTYHYTVVGGDVRADSGWVAANIRTEDMPIVGRVQCHKVMLPQLRAALIEVVKRGLGPKIRVTNGCFNDRFIAGSTRLSNHAFGMAIDFDAATNGRGTRGTMDPTVVSIFKKWGFGWGGDWAYTDPMHFELERIVRVA